jgi:hypothetical protein
MFVVPSVVEPVSMSQRNRVEEALRVYETFQGGVRNYDLSDQPRIGSGRPGQPAKGEQR